MAVCPNCSSEVSPTDPRCSRCGADFTAADGWKPRESDSQSNTDGADRVSRSTFVAGALGVLHGMLLGGLQQTHSILAMDQPLKIVVLFAPPVLVCFAASAWEGRIHVAAAAAFAAGVAVFGSLFLFFFALLIAPVAFASMFACGMVGALLGRLVRGAPQLIERKWRSMRSASG